MMNLKTTPDELEMLINDMKGTYQFKDMNILQHGQSVAEEYQRVVEDNGKRIRFGLKELEKSLEYNESVKFIDFLLENQYDNDIMKQYQIYHDCGKPYCHKTEEVIDSEGNIQIKQHFPDHAKVSSETFAKYFDSPLITQLILDDMNYHILKGELLDNWLQLHINNPKYLCSLYVTAWSEIISNSKMFGGMDSTSYKIKRKTLITSAKKLYKLYKLFFKR